MRSVKDAGPRACSPAVATHRIRAIVTVASMSAALLTVQGPAAQAATVTQTFAYIGAEQSFIVPSGVTSVRITAIGGKGSTPGSETAGAGGFVTATVAVAPLAALTIAVAGDATEGGGGFGGGGGSDRGGGGGGASSVHVGNDLLVIAGGGGGGGSDRGCFSGFSGPGAGGAAGEAGGNGESCGVGALTLTGGGGGQGGSDADDAGAAGTAVGSNACYPSTSGARGSDGGAPSNNIAVGGGAGLGGAGGAGYQGGGSGGSGASADFNSDCSDEKDPGGEAGSGGGGGGSNYAVPTALAVTAGVSDRTDANGLVEIAYDAPADTTAPTLTVPEGVTEVATGPSGATVRYVVTATDEAGVTSGPTCTPSSGSSFALGTTVVTCTAADAAGNIGSASFTVTVVPNRSDLAVRVTGPAQAPTSGTVSYEVKVTNAGPAPAKNVVTVLSVSGLTTTSTAPATSTGTVRIGPTTLTGARWAEASIASGSTVTYVLTGRVLAKRGQSVAALGGALASTPDPRIVNNLAGATTRVQ